MKKPEPGIREELLFYYSFLFISAFLLFTAIVLTFTRYEIERLEEKHYGDLIQASVKLLEEGKMPEVPSDLSFIIDAEKEKNQKLALLCINASGIRKEKRGKFIEYLVPLPEEGKKCAVYIFKKGRYVSELVSLFTNFILFTLLFSAVFIIFGYSILNRTILKPIRALFNAVKEISLGREEERAPEIGPKEVKYLSASFNRLVEELVKRKKELERTVMELEEVNREMKKTQEEMIQAEKLASIGRLAAGLAHELGNPLSTITMTLELLSPHLDEKGKEYMERIEGEIRRMDGIIRSLLDLSRPARIEMKKFHPGEVIRRVLSIVFTPKDSEYLEVEFVSGYEGEIFSDPGLFSQILINILLNAKDAVKEKGKGKITVRTRKEGEFFVTDVIDTGTGMDEETLKKAFEPFFTTKPPGKGTGLGLSISQKLTILLGGRLSAESKKGAGSTFSIHLPLSKEGKPSG